MEVVYSMSFCFLMLFSNFYSSILKIWLCFCTTYMVNVFYHVICCSTLMGLEKWEMFSNSCDGGNRSSSNYSLLEKDYLEICKFDRCNYFCGIFGYMMHIFLISFNWTNENSFLFFSFLTFISFYSQVWCTWSNKNKILTL